MSGPSEPIRPGRVDPPADASATGKHVLPAPPVIPERRPLVVIRRNPAKRDRRVDGRGSAGDAAPRVGDRPPWHGLGPEAAIVLPERHRPTVLQVPRRRLE